MTLKQEHHIPVTESLSAVELLSENTDFSRQKIKQFMQKGCVWLEQDAKKNQRTTQRIRRAKKSLSVGDILHFYYDKKVLSSTPEAAELISDQGAYSIWNKPSGMLSQGSKWGDHCTINRWAEKNLKPERPAFIVHRLDRAASGLIILAHRKQTAAQFSKMFEKREIEKHYEVKVQGDFSQAFPEFSNHKKTIDEPIDDKSAISHIQFLNYDKANNASLLDVNIETGRKHQIRKHLLGVGFLVIGDRLYGSKNKDYEEDLKLKAVLLKFICPVKNEEVLFRLKTS